jgi:hypothetical protein
MDHYFEWFAVAQLQSEVVLPQLEHITTMAAWQISRGANAQAATNLIRSSVVAVNLLNYAEVENICKFRLHQQRCTHRHLLLADGCTAGFQQRAFLLQGAGPHALTKLQVVGCNAQASAMCGDFRYLC